MKNKHCFARNHMTCRQFGLWNVVREVQSKWGFIYFDGDDLAHSFKDTSRDAIFDDCKSLLKSNWFELLEPRQRKKDGTWQSRKIRALSHKEWSEKTGAKCFNAGVDQSPIATGKAAIQSPNATDRLPNATDQSLQSNKDKVPYRYGSTSDRVLPNQSPIATGLEETTTTQDIRPAHSAIPVAAAGDSSVRNIPQTSKSWWVERQEWVRQTNNDLTSLPFDEWRRQPLSERGSCD